MAKPTFEKVFVGDIKVGVRRREELGDIPALAENISKRGLLHPIVVDDDLNLVAGERRLRAHQHLGESEIFVRYLRDLSEDERREIELEENDFRLDLTAFERSKNLSDMADTAARVIEGEFSSASDENLADKNPKGGRPKKPASEDKIAERIGKSRGAIHNAKAHVKAVEDHPELKDLPTQKDALAAAKALDALSPKEQKEAAKQIKNAPTPEAKQKVVQQLSKAPLSNARQWAEWIQDARRRFFRFKADNFKSGNLVGFTDADKNMVLEGIDLFVDELTTCRNDLLGGVTYDEFAEEAFEGAVN